eukprot:30276-Pelagococcus_subviridis.AAC.3
MSAAEKRGEGGLSHRALDGVGARFGRRRRRRRRRGRRRVRARGGGLALAALLGLGRRALRGGRGRSRGHRGGVPPAAAVHRANQARRLDEQRLHREILRRLRGLRRVRVPVLLTAAAVPAAAGRRALALIEPKPGALRPQRGRLRSRRLLFPRRAAAAAADLRGGVRALLLRPRLIPAAEHRGEVRHGLGRAAVPAPAAGRAPRFGVHRVLSRVQRREFRRKQILRAAAAAAAARRQPRERELELGLVVVVRAPGEPSVVVHLAREVHAREPLEERPQMLDHARDGTKRLPVSETQPRVRDHGAGDDAGQLRAHEAHARGVERIQIRLEVQLQMHVRVPVHRVEKLQILPHPRPGGEPAALELRVEGPRVATDGGVGGVERRQKRSRKASRCVGMIESEKPWAERRVVKSVLEERRAPRQRNRMGTSACGNKTRLHVPLVHVVFHRVNVQRGVEPLLQREQLRGQPRERPLICEYLRASSLLHITRHLPPRLLGREGLLLHATFLAFYALALVLIQPRELVRVEFVVLGKRAVGVVPVVRVVTVSAEASSSFSAGVARASVAAAAVVASAVAVLPSGIDSRFRSGVSVGSATLPHASSSSRIASRTPNASPRSRATSNTVSVLPRHACRAALRVPRFVSSAGSSDVAIALPFG